MFEYFGCVLGGIRAPISDARSRLAVTDPWYVGPSQLVPGASPIRPDSCESSRRMVTLSIGLTPTAALSSGTWATTGSSRPRRPSSRSCMIAVPVNVLVTEATR